VARRPAAGDVGLPLGIAGVDPTGERLERPAVDRGVHLGPPPLDVGERDGHERVVGASRLAVVDVDDARELDLDEQLGSTTRGTVGTGVVAGGSVGTVGSVGGRWRDGVGGGTAGVVGAVRPPCLSEAGCAWPRG
jgi:hypothetical protein